MSKASNIYRKSTGEIIFKIVNYTLLIIFCLLIVLPFLNILALSFNEGKDAVRGGIYFWPRTFTLANYKETFTNSNILNAYGVTVFRTVVGTVLAVFFSALAAYALKNGKTLRGKNFITMFIFFTSLFNGGLIPFYLLLRRIDLFDTIWVFIIPSIYSVWNIMILRTFFNSIDKGIEESAIIDGCNDFGVFFKIMMPLSKPALSVICLFVGVGHWNDWFTGAFFVQSNNLRPVQTLLQEMLTSTEVMNKLLAEGGAAAYYLRLQVTGESLKMATIVVATAPIIFVYPFIQRYFVKGLMIGSIKG